VDRHALKSSFNLKHEANWNCPTCRKGVLRIRRDTFFSDERKHSRNHDQPGWEPEWIESVYSCLMDCSNEHCKEVVASSGTGFLDSDIVLDGNGCPEQVYEERFRPKHFQPHLKIFEIPRKCPESVAKPLNDSFALFFSAPHAASNNARIAIEALLTELGVPRVDMAGKNKGGFIPLQRRINLLPPEYEALKNMFSAVKWLGNAGSHEGSMEMTTDDVLDSYQIVEHILQEIYAPRLKEILQLTEKIIKHKGPAK